MHRYLTAGANGTVPAHEITVVHGLVVKNRINLGGGAYVAPYGDARAEFGLPDEPEQLSKANIPEAAVLVRSLEYGPGVAPLDDDYDLPVVQISYRFPSDHRIDLDSWFDEKLVVELLSIATRFPLLSRTRYVRVARWIEDIDPNFAFGAQISEGFISDVWPGGHELSKGDVDAFLELACSWHTFPDKPEVVELAIRRLAASVLSSWRPIWTGRLYSRCCHSAGSALRRYDRPQARAARRSTAWNKCHGAEADIRPSEGFL